jgi:hypothetical protein
MGQPTVSEEHSSWQHSSVSIYLVFWSTAHSSSANHEISWVCLNLFADVFQPSEILPPAYNSFSVEKSPVETS